MGQKCLRKLLGLLLFFALAVPSVPRVPRNLVADVSLTPSETKVVSLVNGSEAYSYDKHLESIALSHYAFRAAGSAGANETADWIADQFADFGLEVEKESFQFTGWDLLGKPELVIDDDGNLSTTADQTVIKSFQCEHYSWPGNVFADLVVLPLPPASDNSQLGATPIGTLWDAIDTTGKVALVGREVRSADNWHETFNNKLRAQPPAAVIHTWWYNWMSFVPDFFSSAGGRPVQFGHYFWNLGIPVGFVPYNDGLFIRNRETSVNVSARVKIDSTVKVGPHYNVVGRLRGYGDPGKSIIVSGHYDTVMCGGFCDNGAGTSGVIELAHLFTEAAKRGYYYPKYTILFIALAGEEIGLVGSINYVGRHKAEMKNITSVINIDCLGSDVLEVTQTDPDHGIDLDQIVLDAAGNLGVNVRLIGRDQSDEAPFLFPPNGDSILMTWWDTSLGIGDAHPVGSSVMLSSAPLLYREVWYTGKPGWIHTSYDNSTSTGTLNWVETRNLEDHIKVATLTIIRVSPSQTFNTDLNNDGRVNILDVTMVAKAFGSKPGDRNWNAVADVDKNGIVNIVDIAIVARDFGKTI
jgi:hypothetical protein